MTPTAEFTDIVVDAQKQALASLKEIGAFSARAFEANIDLADRVLTYQRNVLASASSAAKKN